MHRSPKAVLVVILSLSFLLSATTMAGEDYSLTEKLLGADAIVIVNLKFDRPIPARCPTRKPARRG